MNMYEVASSNQFYVPLKFNGKFGQCCGSAIVCNKLKMSESTQKTDLESKGFCHTVVCKAACNK